MNKNLWKHWGKIAAAFAAIGVGAAIGGNVLYNEGMLEGGSRVYDAASDVYEDFHEKMQEYANRDEKEEDNEEDS